MNPRVALLALSLTGCGGVTVYLPDSPPSQRCMLIAPVKASLRIPASAPDRGVLRAQALESCKQEARDAGANALFLTGQAESESAISCSGVAYACP